MTEPVGVIGPKPVTVAVKVRVCPAVVGGAVTLMVGTALATLVVVNPLEKPYVPFPL